MRWMLAAAAIVGIAALAGVELYDAITEAVASIAAIDLAPMVVPLSSS